MEEHLRSRRATLQQAGLPCARWTHRWQQREDHWQGLEATAAVVKVPRTFREAEFVLWGLQSKTTTSDEMGKRDCQLAEAFVLRVFQLRNNPTVKYCDRSVVVAEGHGSSSGTR